MGVVYSSVLPAPVAEVFEWHTRPGAMTRLAPPWQPVRIAAESRDLRTGQAVLRLPGGLRWIARHDPDAYEPGKRFVDELTSLPLHWRHAHEFTDADGETRMTDRVDSPVPGRALRRMFAYRHRQLAGELRARHRMLAFSERPLTVAITGSSGLVGTALTALLGTNGHQVLRLVRRQARSESERRWNPEAPDADLLRGVDAVIHLAGKPLMGRFTSSHLRAIYESRVGPTARLAELVARSGIGTFITASAVGYYGNDRGEEELTEDSEPGQGYLADLVVDWEEVTKPARDAGARVVCVRTGLVQTPAGGLLRLLYPLFAAGLGGRIGSGRQWWPWIGLDDLLDIYHRALLDDELSGPVNAVAPNPVRNREYARTLGRVLARPTPVPVPPLGPQLLLGKQGGQELAEAGQRVLPARLIAREHVFRFPELEPLLRHVLGR